MVRRRAPLVPAPHPEQGVQLPASGVPGEPPLALVPGPGVTNRTGALAAVVCLVVWHRSILIPATARLGVINGWRKTNFLLILL